MWGRRLDVLEEEIANLLEERDEELDGEISGSDEDQIEQDSVFEDEQSGIESDEEDAGTARTSFSQSQPLNREQSNPDANDSLRKLSIGSTKFSVRGQILFALTRGNLITGKIRNARSYTPYKWSTLPLPPQRTSARNIVNVRPEPKSLARDVSTAEEVFDLFFDEKVLEVVLSHTNSEMSQQKASYAKDQTYTKNLTKTELRAYIGLLYLMAVKKDNRVSTDFLWSVCGSPVYNAMMSKERFQFITNCLRFDDRVTREDRKKVDPFTHVRELWEMFMQSCASYYQPSPECTMDEQLISFRGRCKFRMYIPNKPDKYGLKLIPMCDARDRHVVSGLPYVGKATPNGDMPLGEYSLKKITKPIHHTNSNITCDNWFTTIPAAKSLLKDCGITIVGTLKKNKTEIPKDMLITKGRPVGSSIFVYDTHNKLQLVTYCPKKGKIVTLLSSMHYEFAINNVSKKPEVIESYNETKGGVDSIDQMCHSYSCSRRTKR